ncbi:VWA domain-containing protein [archaeon]|jgi:Ca-activated chloride channel homolog|nr:VWA domain-containing protein [archaeon]MBT4241696.1 VWA domain-containing protein [archaeon]MBT4418244.1 VWA domain-containing protein [archaeon]
MEFGFTHQIYLLFLFLIPAIIFLHFYGLKNLRGRGLRFANFEAISRVKGIDLYSKNIWGLILNIIIISFLVFSLAGLTLYQEMDVSDFSFVVAIDVSESMTADDVEPNRLEAAKETAIEFIETLPFESYTGVVSFSGNSFIEQELTKDKTALKDSINRLEIGEVSGTDIFEAVTTSNTVLGGKRNKAIVLLSDGQINVGNFDQVLDFAIEREILIHTIGVGSLEGGETSFGFSKTDEDSLKSLSYNTRGEFFRAEDKETLRDSFNEIVEVTRRRGSIELNSYMIIIAMLLFILEIFLINTNRIF